MRRRDIAWRLSVVESGFEGRREKHEANVVVVLSTAIVSRVARSFGFFSLALAASIARCAPQSTTPIGMTRQDRAAAEPVPSASTSASAPTLEPWSHASTFRGWTRVNVRRFISGGHLLGKVDGDVFVSPDALEAYGRLGPGRALPVGAVVVEAHSTSDRAGPIFAMEKGADGWSFVEMNAEARVVRRGALAPCVGCHAHVADQDRLFGVPLPGR